jgi:long-chain acyl-CoA synthetase
MKKIKDRFVKRFKNQHSAQNGFSSLTDFFQKQAQDNPALVVHQNLENRTTTQSVGNLYEMSLRVAHFLQAHGLRKGDRVALVSKNRPEWLGIYIGIINAGCCALPIDAHLTGMEVKNLIRDSKAKIMFIERELFGAVRDLELERMVDKFVILDAEINYLSKCIPFGWILKNNSSEFQPVEGHLEDDASLIYTSGTTGNPKGVVLKHKNLLSQVSIRKLMGTSKRSRVLLTLPLNHAYAFSSCFLVPLAGGSGIYILNSIKSTDLLEFVQKYRITVMVFVPAILTQFYKSIVEKMNCAPNYAQLLFHLLKKIKYFSKNGSHLSLVKRRMFKKIHAVFGGCIEYFISGAAGLDEEISRTFNTLGLPIYEGYGLTETAPVITFNHPASNKPGTVGKPIKGVDLKILSPSKDGVGDIAVKGSPVFSGYQGGINFESPFTSDGYFLTGDLGFVDRQGFLTISGRSKDVIVLPSGKNVFPGEIEDFYLQAECFKEMAVLGVPREIGRKAEEIYAIIVPKEAFFKAHNITDVETFVKNTVLEMSERLPSWCRVNRFELRSEALPRTTTRKVKKFVLREEIIEKMKNNKKKDIEVIDDVLNSPMGRILEAAIIKVKGSKMKYSSRSNLFLDLGFDSLSISEMFVSIEAVLGKTIPKEIMREIRSVGDCILFLGEFCSQSGINMESLSASVTTPESDAKHSWSEVLDTNTAPEVDAEIKRRLYPQSSFRKLIKSSLINVMSLMGRVACRVEVSGLENLPLKAPFIFAADHASYMDPLFVLSALPRELREHFFVIGKKEHLQRIDRSLFAWLARMIPIDREGNFIPALQTGKKVIDAGHILFIHPEGTPSMDGMLNRFKNGVGILSEVTGVPIVPIHLDGTFNVLNRDQVIPRLAKVKIRFGKPIFPDKVLAEDSQKKYEAITSEVERRIVELGAKPRFVSKETNETKTIPAARVVQPAPVIKDDMQQPYLVRPFNRGDIGNLDSRLSNG